MSQLSGRKIICTGTRSKPSKTKVGSPSSKQVFPSRFNVQNSPIATGTVSRLRLVKSVCGGGAVLDAAASMAGAELELAAFTVSAAGGVNAASSGFDVATDTALDSASGVGFGSGVGTATGSGLASACAAGIGLGCGAGFVTGAGSGLSFGLGAGLATGFGSTEVTGFAAGFSVFVGDRRALPAGWLRLAESSLVFEGLAAPGGAACASDSGSALGGAAFGTGAGGGGGSVARGSGSTLLQPLMSTHSNTGKSKPPRKR